MTGRLAIGLIGAGRLGRVYARDLASRIAETKLVAVADPVEAVAKEVAAEFDVPRHYADPLALIDDPAVDAVVIVSPTHTHRELVIAAAGRKKPTFCEKPPALSLAECTAMADAENRSGTFFQMGFMRRFDPGYVRAKQLIETGELGRIEQFRAYSRDTFPPPLEFLLTSGGSFLDMAVHDLDLARFLVGEVEEVHAWASVLFDERFSKADDWDTSVAMLRFGNGAFGVVETSRHSAWGYDIRTEVAGAAGKVVVDGGQKTPATYLRKSAYEGDLYESFPDRFEVAYRRELEAFFDDLAAGRTPRPGPEDALETLRLAVACTKSWREGRPVRLDEVA